MGDSHSKYKLTDDDIWWFSKNTLMREQDVMARYQDFIQQHPTGKIPKAEFMNLMKACYGKKANHKGLEKYVYEIYDRDGDGFVDFKEFLKVIYILSEEPPRRKAHLLFRMYDRDQSGSISPNELKDIIQSFYHILGKHLSRRMLYIYIYIYIYMQYREYLITATLSIIHSNFFR